MTKSAVTLENSLQRRARMMARKYDLQLVCEGQQAYCRPGKIVLPALPPDLDAETLADLDGYLEHEVAHINHTDFLYLDTKGFEHDLHKNMWNMCEDSWIEVQHNQQYDGAVATLRRLNEKWEKINHARWSELPAGFRIVSNVRYLMEDKPTRLDADIAPAFTSRVIALCLTLRLALNTSEIHGLTRKICTEMMAALKEQEKQQQKQEQEQQEPQTEDDSEGEGSEGSGKSVVTPGELRAPEHYETEVPHDLHSYIDLRLQQVITEAEKQQDKRGRKIVANEEFATGRSIPASTADDEFLDRSQERSSAYRAISQRVRSASAKLSRELEEILVAEENEQWLLEQEEGRVDRRGLVRLGCDSSYKTPFKRLVKNEVRDVGVSLVIDESASMSGTKMDLARECAIVLGEALAAAGIDFEVGGFTTTCKIVQNPAPLANRIEGLRHTLYKSFESDNLQSLVNLTEQSNNADGESVRFFGERLLRSEATRKVMFVLSDGHPSAACRDMALQNKDLQDAVAEVTAAGIEVIGIGICSDAVTRFYPQAVVVREAKDLTRTLAKEIKKLLARSSS